MMYLGVGLLGVLTIALGIALLTWPVAAAGIFLVAVGEFGSWRTARRIRGEEIE